MKALVVPFALGAATLVLAGCEQYAPAQAAAAPGYGAPASATASNCFRTYDIRNHTVVDENTILLRLTDRSVYRVETSGGCFAGATTSDPIITRTPPGSNYVCKPIDLDLGVTIGGGFAKHCIVSAIRPMSPGDVAALPPKLRP